MKRCRLVVLLACLLAPGFAQALMAGSLPDTPAVRVDANTPGSRWAGVGALRVNGNHFSAVAISARHVLTAAHVAASGVATPANVSFVLNDGSTRHFVAQKVEVFADYRFPYDDLAVVTLAEPLPAGTPVYPVLDTSLQVGAVLRFVGYGRSGQGDSGASVTADMTVKRVGENTVDALESWLDATGNARGEGSSFYLYDFDGPAGQGLGNARETMVAVGDSGSPAFVDTGSGVPLLAGINTFASPLGSGRALDYTFGQGGGGMLLSDRRFIAWLKERTGNAVVMASTMHDQTADVPLPMWSLLLLGAAMGWGIAGRKRNADQPHG